MLLRSSQVAAVSMFVLAGMVLPQTLCHGDNLPSLDQLIQSTPRIDTSNRETHSFQFTVRADSPKLCFETTIAWRRNELVGMRMLIGKDRIPAWMISNQQTQMLDVSHRQLLLLPPAYPEFHLRRTGGNLQLNWGIDTEMEDIAPIVLDLKSIIGEPRQGANISLDEDGMILVTVSPSEIDETREGFAEIVALYEPRAPYKLIRLELKSREGKPLLQVSDISFNEQTNIQWPTPPVDETLIEGITITDRSSRAAPSLVRSVDLGLTVGRVFLLNMALGNEAFRQNAMFSDVDWEMTRRFALEAGPKVERLWR